MKCAGEADQYERKHQPVTKYSDQQTEVSPLRSYLELLRLPNIFTALADVLMGFLFVQTVWVRDFGIDVEVVFLRPGEKWVLGLLAAASAMLYAAGVVLNDVFDVELDRKERPERPLPSGRVSLRAARWLGWELLLWGTAMGWGASLVSKRLWPPDLSVSAPVQFRPGIVATVLAATIVLYNAGLKRTPLGPLVMGACRMLNVLLGMSVLPGPWGPENWLVAGAIGVYITGVTWFARDESTRSSGPKLAAATVVMLAGVAMLAGLRHLVHQPEVDLPWLENIDPGRWYLAMGLLGAIIAMRCFWAIGDPGPSRVRQAVAQAIVSLVVLDAVACCAARGPYWAAIVLVLVLPTILLSRWIQPT
jgi:4-hydroxybenzoate polyprenyltransferase